MQLEDYNLGFDYNGAGRGKLLRSQMKQTGVMERVLEPGGRHKAWQQVKKNAGAAGIDRMTIRQFESRKTELLGVIPGEAEGQRLSLHPSRKGSDTKGKDLTDEEVRDSGGNGPSSQSEGEFSIRRGIGP
jgi:hypothetical protein